MDVQKVLGIMQVAVPVHKILFREHGFIHDRNEAEINGIRGFFVWDWIIWNEITFDDMDGNMISFFTSISDKATQAKWDELIDKYGIKK